MTRIFRTSHMLAMVAALFITTTAFSTAMMVPADQASVTIVALA